MSDLFAGVRVVDAASFLAGPAAATILAEHGADVIKVEPPGGDRHRSIAAGHPADYSWQLTDRNRRGVGLDLTTPEGSAILREMLKSADVFLVNWHDAQLARFGFDWDTLHALNPRIILAQVTAYGQVGDDAGRRGFDLTTWFARSGIQDAMRDKDQVALPPPGGVGDHMTAMTLYAGIVTALLSRERTGRGSHVHTSLVAAGTWANGLALQGVIAGVDGSARRDQEGFSNPLQNIYRTRDGEQLFFAVQNIPRDYPRLLAVLGCEHWLSEPDMQPVKPLFKNRFRVRERIGEAVAAMDATDLCQGLNAAGIVHSLVARNGDVVNDPHLHANGVFIDFDSGKPGCDKTLATPFRISDAPAQPPSPAPELGQHSVEVLRELGIDETRLQAAIESGVVVAPVPESTGRPAD